MARLDTTTYLMDKADALMIQYENGTKDILNTQEDSSDSVITAQKNHRKTEPLFNYTFYEHNGKRKVITGAVLTGIGVPCLITGVALFALGNDSHHSYGRGTSSVLFVMGGTLLGAVGFTLTIVGPITLAKGLRYSKVARKLKPEFSFVPSSQHLPYSNFSSTTGAMLRVVF